jgi:surface polysaccharide O-acyltransferase-like enzyme
MFVIYYLFAYLESKLKWKSWVPIVLLFIVSLGFYETCYQPAIFPWAQGYKGEPIQWLDDTSLGQVMMYFPFFLYGNIVHRYWDRSQRVMDSKWFFPLIVTIVIFSTLDVIKWHTMRQEWTNIPSTLAKFGLLTIVFMYFRYYKDHFTKLSVVGSSLQYIGRRTLDIYLIHFFFLPNIPTIGMFFNKYRHNFVLDTTLAVVIALLIIAFCIVTSNILRISPLFRKYLFGR